MYNHSNIVNVKLEIGEGSSKAALTSGLPGDGRSHPAYPVRLTSGLPGERLRACAGALGCGRQPNARGRHPKVGGQ